jgi:hypothetical protein
MRAGVRVVFALVAVVAIDTASAHKGITSKLTYNTDVYPVLLNRCGRCHVDGGVGPMSLLKYEDAFPWAEALRSELLAAPIGDPHDFVKAAHRQITARELDIVLDWATGGTPEGDKAATPAPVTFKNDWASGKPDITATLAAPYEIPASALEATGEFVLPVQLVNPRTLGRFDVLPGNPAIVRSANLSLRYPDGTSRALGLWFPRQTPVAIAVKPAIRLDPGSAIIARIYYKKTWKYEGEPMTDRSTVGLYLTD